MPQPLYDSHAHFFSSDFARYPINIANAREGEENLRRRIESEPLTPERVFRFWDETGVAAGCAVQYNQVYKRDNSYALDVSDAHPDRVSPVVMLDPLDPATPETLDWMIAKRGVVALRLFGAPADDGAYPWLDSPAALNCWRVVERRGRTMVIMYIPSEASPGVLGRIEALGRRFPGATIALDHCGWPNGATPDEAISAPLLALRPLENVTFKATTINFRRFFDKTGLDAAAFVRRMADLFGIERIMWGSDVGNTPETYAQMTERARNSAKLLSPAEQAKYLHDNAHALFARR